MWESYGAALLYGGDLIRTGAIARGYEVAADLGAICTEPDRNFTQGEDAQLLDRMHEEILRAVREVMGLAGLDELEIERRMQMLDELHGEGEGA
jgi:hypothetical protein